MNYKALYRTYRPSSFEDVVGQKHIVATLKNAVKQNKIAHAYLFCGPRGTGKTSVAKLLAKAVNCENSENAPCGKCRNCLSIEQGNHPDIVEIDAASNNGVDEIRDLIEKVKYSPIEGKYKVYIIDEVHMLSAGAFNALLKTLEEPPSHVLFVLATTEPHKVLPTIISRCQRYDFNKVENEEMARRIRYILEKEKIECDEEAIRLIVSLADGGMRDALSILDQCIAYAQNQITAAHVNEIYGITTTEEKLQLLEFIFRQDARNLLGKVKIWSEKGIDIRRLTADLIEILKEAVIFGYTKDDTLLMKINSQEAETILGFANPKKLLDQIQILMETTEKYRTASNVTSYFEVAALKMMGEMKNLFHDDAALAENGNKEETFVNPSKEKNHKDTNFDQDAAELVFNESKEGKSAEEPEEIVDSQGETETIIPVPLVENTSAELVIQEIHQKNIPKKISIDEILGLMVQANKPEKLSDQEKWKRIEGKCRDLSCARYAACLKDTMVAVSGANFILIATLYEALANEIQEDQDELEIFLRTDLDIPKRLYITTQEQFKEATQQFIERRRAGTLPPPLVIEVKSEIKEEAKEESDPNLTEMTRLFGSDFEIIEEEEK